MKKYKVNVNGTAYEITLEVVDVADAQVAAPVQAPAVPAAPVAAEPAPAPVQTAAPAGAEQICAPMPGTILAVNVAAGDTVKKGQVLLILEAMKMENEIMAPRDGVIGSVNTSKGSSVDTGALLCTLA